MEVELQVFSGRPNPKWVMSGAQATDMLKRIRSLRTAANEVRAPDLGFRGFIVRYAETVCCIYRRRVTLTVASAKRTYQDTTGVESALRQQAVRRGFQSLLDADDKF
jgi:hypothetical protein